MRILACTFFLSSLSFFACKNDGTTSNPEAKTNLPADSILLEEEEAVEMFFPGFLRKYEGTIGGKEKISIVFTHWGDGFLSAKCWVGNAAKPLELSGDLVGDSLFQLSDEFEKKSKNVLSGSLDISGNLKADWQGKSMKKPEAATLTAVPEPPVAAQWAGSWHLNEIWDGGTLLIGNTNEKSFDFALTIHRSSHTGVIEGTANFTIDHVAVFKRKEFEDEPCELVFKNFGNKTIIVEQNSSNFACGFGARANAGGTYMDKWLRKKPKLKVGAGEDDVFPTQALHDAFRQLVGTDNYETFAFNLQILEKSQSLPADGFSATVVSGFVQGLNASNEAIILFDGSGNIRAATIDFEEEGENGLLRYFSNVPEWKGKLPATIEDWRAGFKGYEVIYSN